MTERAEAIERAVAAYRTLGELAETIEDEWQYVFDLTEAYTPNLEGLAGGPPLVADVVAAIDEAVAEVELITDPHKAIDWLSTFPHLIALAVGGDVDADRAGAAGAGASTSEPDEPDDDSPFGALLRRSR